MSKPIQLVVGLGNPGTEYEQTRHNAGFWYADALADQLGATFSLEKKLSAQVAKAHWQNRPLWIAKPTTYMNESGIAVQALMQFYKVPVESLLVAHDELDLPTGVVKLKSGGGTAGHNGLKSIIKSLGQKAQFHRTRIGIGHPGHAKKVHNYVLSRASDTEQTTLLTGIQNLLPHTDELLAGHFEKLMKTLHTKETAS